MFTVAQRLIWSAIAVAAALSAQAGALAPSAWADATDAKFLNDIDGIGVPESQTTLIAAAHKICTLHDRGWNDDEIDATIADTFPNWNEAQLVMLLIDSVADYCPQYMPPGVPR
jgi:hypothetical protein